MISTDVDVNGVYHACCADCDWRYSNESERVVNTVADFHNDLYDAACDDHNTGLYWTTDV